MKQFKLAYWSVAIFALVNAFFFMMSLFAQAEPDDMTRYLHYNLVLAVGYVLVFMICRFSRSPVGLLVSIFLFTIGLIASQETITKIPIFYMASWSWIKWVVVAPILITLIKLLIHKGDPELDPTNSQDPHKQEFRP